MLERLRKAAKYASSIVSSEAPKEKDVELTDVYGVRQSDLDALFPEEQALLQNAAKLKQAKTDFDKASETSLFTDANEKQLSKTKEASDRLLGELESARVEREASLEKSFQDHPQNPTKTKHPESRMVVSSSQTAQKFRVHMPEATEGILAATLSATASKEASKTQTVEAYYNKLVDGFKADENFKAAHHGKSPEELDTLAANKAYRALALIFHPDRNPGLAAAFQELADAHKARTDGEQTPVKGLLIKEKSEEAFQRANNTQNPLSNSSASTYLDRDSSILSKVEQHTPFSSVAKNPSSLPLESLEDAKERERLKAAAEAEAERLKQEQLAAAPRMNFASPSVSSSASKSGPQKDDYQSFSERFPANNPSAIKPEVEGKNLRFKVPGDDGKHTGELYVECQPDGKYKWTVDKDIKAPKVITIHDDKGNLKEAITIDRAGKVTDYKGWDAKGKAQGLEHSKFDKAFLEKQGAKSPTLVRGTSPTSIARPLSPEQTLTKTTSAEAQAKFDERSAELKKMTPEQKAHEVKASRAAGDIAFDPSKFIKKHPGHASVSSPNSTTSRDFQAQIQKDPSRSC